MPVHTTTTVSATRVKVSNLTTSVQGFVASTIRSIAATKNAAQTQVVSRVLVLTKFLLTATSLVARMTRVLPVRIFTTVETTLVTFSGSKVQFIFFTLTQIVGRTIQNLGKLYTTAQSQVATLVTVKGKAVNLTTVVATTSSISKVASKVILIVVSLVPTNLRAWGKNLFILVSGIPPFAQPGQQVNALMQTLKGKAATFSLVQNTSSRLARIISSTQSFVTGLSVVVPSLSRQIQTRLLRSQSQSASTTSILGKGKIFAITQSLGVALARFFPQSFSALVIGVTNKTIVLVKSPFSVGVNLILSIRAQKLLLNELLTTIQTLSLTIFDRTIIKVFSFSQHYVVSFFNRFSLKLLVSIESPLVVLSSGRNALTQIFQTVVNQIAQIFGLRSQAEWKYDGNSTIVFAYDLFPANSGLLRLDCSDDKSNTPQMLNVLSGSSGFLSILRVGFNYGNGPGITATLWDITTGETLFTQDFVYGVPFGNPITEVPYGLELGDRNDVTPDGYMDANTVKRWSSVGYYDGIYARPRQLNLGSNQRWYDAGYDTGSALWAQLNPYA